MACSPVRAHETPWKSDKVLLFLHRSASMAAPENTVPALEAAVKQGADGVEIDIRRTRDGYFVLYHDDWVLEDRGPGGKIEDLPLSAVLTLDVGKRFGPQWRGLRVPLLGDVLRFARANHLLLYLDIKTPGIYDTVLQMVKDADCLPLVRNVGGQVPKDTYRSLDSMPFIKGWNYTDGGEEDPERIAEAKKQIPSEGCQIMADDARAWATALGRHPEKRPFTPFRASRLPVKPTSLPVPRLSESTEVLLARGENPGAIAPRLAALWELGTRQDTAALRQLEALAMLPYPEKANPENYDAFFVKIGAACALARYSFSLSRPALRRLVDSPGKYDRSAASFALAAFAPPTEIPWLAELVTADPRNNGIVRDVVLGYAGRFGSAALPIYEAALPCGGFAAKLTVFGLVNQGKAADSLTRKLVGASTTPPLVRRRAELVRYWRSR